MARRIAAVFLCVFTLALLATPVSARFYENGEYSNTGRYGFCFEPEDAVLVYYDDAHYYPYDDVWAGSKLYVPVFCDYDDEIATMQQITDGKAGITYKANRLVDSVKLEEVGADFSDLMDPGVYAVVSFSEDYTEIAGTSVDVRLVLTVDNVARQETMAAFADTVKNRVIDLHRNSVYSATRPSVFSTDYYAGETVFDFGGDIRYTTVVAKNARYFLKLDRSEIKPLAENNKKVYMEYYDFMGDNDTFVRDGKLQIPVDRDKFKAKRNANPQIYAYQYNNGSLRAMEASEISFDSKRDIITISTSKLETYVLSAQALLPDVDESSDDILKVGYAKNNINEPSTAQSAPPVSSAPPLPPEVSAANPTTGGDTIYAFNKSAGNPNTSDGRSVAPLPVLLLATASVAALLKLLKKRAD